MGNHNLNNNYFSWQVGGLTVQAGGLLSWYLTLDSLAGGFDHC